MRGKKSEITVDLSDYQQAKETQSLKNKHMDLLSPPDLSIQKIDNIYIVDVLVEIDSVKRIKKYERKFYKSIFGLCFFLLRRHKLFAKGGL